MGKNIFLILAVVFVGLLATAFAFYSYYFGFPSFQSGNGQPYVPVLTTAENLPAYLSESQMIKDLPENTKLEVNIGGYSYSYENGEVNTGSIEGAEISISLPEKYISRIGEVGLCEAVREANNNGELSFQSSISNTDFLLKYGKLLRYKECLS